MTKVGKSHFFKRSQCANSFGRYTKLTTYCTMYEKSSKLFSPNAPEKTPPTPLSINPPYNFDSC